MPASQPNATEFNPNDLALTCVARYERLIHAPLERVWENVLDWEHLPHLHQTSFGPIEVDEAGDWGWRTWSNPERTDHIELTVASSDSYVARTYLGGRQVSEIWTRVTDQGDGVLVNVDFHLPDVEAAGREKLGGLMLELYTRLWDEDEEMMKVRHQRLHEVRDARMEKNLGEEAVIRQQIEQRGIYSFELGKRAFNLRCIDNQLIAHQSICPHLLGPLDELDAASGTVRCPWHGYRFDLKTGACVSPKDARCSLGKAPAINLEDGDVIVTLS